MRLRLFLPFTFALLALPVPAWAEFSLTSAIIEFNSDKPTQQDIEIVSRSKDTQYLVSEVYEIKNPGLANESREQVTDPTQGQLLVTPDKIVLAGGSRKVLRFVYLGAPGDKEHVYRVVVKPVIKGLDNKAQVGLKVLVGYEVLVIVRPAQMKPAYKAARQGKTMVISNDGNTNILFQGGAQCPAGTSPPSTKCIQPPVIRVYPGQKSQTELPLDQPVFYSVWDGSTTTEQQF